MYNNEGFKKILDDYLRKHANETQKQTIEPQVHDVSSIIEFEATDPNIYYTAIVAAIIIFILAGTILGIALKRRSSRREQSQGFKYKLCFVVGLFVMNFGRGLVYLIISIS